MTITTQCTSSTTLELDDLQRREDAIRHFYAVERNAGADPETAYSRAQEFARDLRRRAAGEGMTLLYSSEVKS